MPPVHDLLSISDIADQLPSILAESGRLKAARRSGARSTSLVGRNIALIFEKPSTRTRTSFEVGINDLGGHAVYLSKSEIQLGRGKRSPTRRASSPGTRDGIVYRAFRHADVVELARTATIPVINALDDLEHPCQIVADLLTMHERWAGGFRGKRLAWIGDGNNVLHSLLLGAAAVGLDLTAATPKAYAADPGVVSAAEALAAKSGAHLRFVEDPAEAATEADALYTDVWVSMGDEAEAAARSHAFQGYQINSALLRRAAPKAFVLHDLPAHRGQEITDDVLDGSQSAAWDQAENRLHAQKAILELLIPPAAKA